MSKNGPFFWALEKWLDFVLFYDQKKMSKVFTGLEFGNKKNGVEFGNKKNKKVRSNLEQLEWGKGHVKNQDRARPELTQP